MPQLDVFSNSYWYIDDGMMNWEYSVFVLMWHVIHRNENVILTEFSSLAALKVVILTTSNDENLVMKVSSKNFISVLLGCCRYCHYTDVIMSLMASQITSLTIVYSNVCSGTDQRKHQSSASLAFVRGIHREPVNSPHKRPVTQKMFPFDDVIM